MTTLVTGASGFVGAAVVRALAARGESLRVMVRKTSRRDNLAGLEAEPVEADLSDPASLRRAVAGCSALYHVAADYRLWARDPAPLYQINVDGTLALLRAAGEAGVGRMVYTSSVATLGQYGDGRPADETTPVTLAAMVGHYKRSKFLAEEAVRLLVADEGLPVVIVNPSTPVGPGDIKPTPTGRVILEAARGKMPAFVDTGLNLVHVDDVAAGHLLAFDQGQVGERYILGGQDLSLAQILGEIARLTGGRPPRIRLPRGPLYPLAYAVEAWARLVPGAAEPLLTVEGLKMSRKKMYFSHEKARRDLGYQPRPALAALGDAIDWFKAAGVL